MQTETPINRKQFKRSTKIDHNIEDPFLECTNKLCKWIGKENNKIRLPYGDGVQIKNCCPNCKGDEFYTLEPKKS